MNLDEGQVRGPGRGYEGVVLGGWLDFTDSQDGRHRITSRDAIIVVRSAQHRWGRRKPWWNIAYMLAWGYDLILGRVR